MKRPSAPDPFADSSLRGPGLWRMLREGFGASRRLLDAVQIEVTSCCPGRCIYCPHTIMRNVWKARHMAPETYLRLWPLFLETTRVHLQGWGEPLLHPRFLDMVALARRADCLVSTTTCGLVMDEDMAASLVDSGLDVIAFSLAGTTAESNNVLRAGVDYGRLLDAVRLLQKVRRKKMGVHLELHFAYLMLAGKIEEVQDLPMLMQELGVHAAVVSTLDYVSAPEWAEEAFAPHEQEKIDEARHTLRQAAAKAHHMGLALYYSLPVADAQPTCPEHPEKSVYVDAQGNLAPCIYTDLPVEAEDPMRRVFGSCLNENPLAVWQGPEFAAFRAALASRCPDAPCVGCSKRFAERNREVAG